MTDQEAERAVNAIVGAVAALGYTVQTADDPRGIIAHIDNGQDGNAWRCVEFLHVNENDIEIQAPTTARTWQALALMRLYVTGWSSPELLTNGGLR